MLHDMDNLIAQLQHAVVRHAGKTTLTQSDIDTMQSCLRELKRYDKMASLR